MATAMIDLDSGYDSGYSGEPVNADLWKSKIKLPYMLIGFGSLQRTVDGAPLEAGYIPSFSCGFGYAGAQTCVGYGMGDFLGLVLDDAIGGGDGLVTKPGYRSGVGAPNLENLGIGYPGPCGQLQGRYVYPRDCLTAVVAVGGPEGATGSLTIPDTATGGGTISGLAFEPNLVLANMSYGSYGTDGPLGCAWGAAGPGIVQWGCGLSGYSWGGFESRNRIFADGDLINIMRDWNLIIQLRITGFTGDGFTYTFTRTNVGGTVGWTPTISWAAYRIPSGEIEVGHGTEGDAGLSTGWRPEAVVYGSVGTTVTGVQGDVFATYGGGVSGAAPMQRVTSMGWVPGSRYDTGVIRFETGNKATQALTDTGADLSWTGGGSSRLFGWVAWGRSHPGSNAKCWTPQLYRWQT